MNFHQFAADNARTQFGNQKYYCRVVRNGNVLHSILCSDEIEAHWIQLEWSEKYKSCDITIDPAE